MTHRWYHRVRWARLGLLVTLPLVLILATELLALAAELERERAALRALRSAVGDAEQPLLDASAPWLDLYEVSDLVGTPPSYPFPEDFDLGYSGGGPGGSCGVLEFDDELPPIQFSPDRLVELVEDELGTGVEYADGVLIVHRDQAGHAALIELLRALRNR